MIPTPWLIGLYLATTLAAPNSSPYIWEKTDESIARVKMNTDGQKQVLWQFNFPKEGRTFFHPVSNSSGVLLTAEAPADHPWHLGLWFCWKYINGLNYWEYAGDVKNRRSEGKTDTRKLDIKTRPDGSAWIKMAIAYHPWDSAGAVVMNETRIMEVTSPDKNGIFSIRFHHTFRAIRDVQLERTPPQTSPGGVSWGGYAGLSVRFDQKLSKPTFSSQTSDSVKSGTNHPWVAASLITSEGRAVQMIMRESPDNPRYPGPWYCINRPAEKFWYYNAAILYHGGITLKAGETMTLRYEVIVPPDPLTRDEIIELTEKPLRVKGSHTP